MKNVTHGWQRKPLAEIAKAEWGNTSITKASYVESGYPAFSAAGPDGFLPKAEWNGPAIILSAIGARCGKCFFADGEWTAIKNTIVIQANAAALSHKFLFYYLNDATRWKISGSGQPFITLKTVRETVVPSLSLPEQLAVVAEIEKQFTRLDAGVAALRRTQANLKRYRAAVLKAACEGRLVPSEAELAKQRSPIHDSISRKSGTLGFESGETLLARILTKRREIWNGRGTYKEPPPAETEKLGTLPIGWTWSSLAQLAAHITDGTHKTPTYVESGVPFLSAKDITGFKISFDECRYIPRSEHDELSKRCATRSGNVLITKSGTIGRVAVVRTDKEFSLFESVANIPVIEPIDSDFVGYAAFVGIAGVFGKNNQKGVAVRHLHLEDLRRVPIPLPPIAEQTRIVAELERRLSVVDELESVVTATLQRATGLRQSVLHGAFNK